MLSTQDSRSHFFLLFLVLSTLPSPYPPVYSLRILSPLTYTNPLYTKIQWYRWLNNEQALEDSANFMRNVKFEGIDEDLTAPGTPWIYFGVSSIGTVSPYPKHTLLTYMC